MWNSKIKKLNIILDVKCDPITYINKYEKYLRKSKNVRFQNMCSYNIASGHLSIRQSDITLEILKYMEDWSKINKTNKALYYSAIFIYYLGLDDLNKAEYIYDNYIKIIRKDVVLHRLNIIGRSSI